MSQSMTALISELRKTTGAGMLNCKKALEACGNDLKAAAKYLRENDQAQAEKKSARTAAEGVVTQLTKKSDNMNEAVMLEVNCETDFVARDENFTVFATSVTERALALKINDVERLLQQSISEDNDQTIDAVRQALVAKIGENIQIRRCCYMTSEAAIGTYVHSGRIGVLVSVKTDNQELPRDLAMQIAASSPLVVSPEQVPESLVEEEKAIFSKQAEESGKPAEIIEKMISGRIDKYLNEVSLLGQPFVKDPSMNVGALIKSHNAQVFEFVRFELGEGIEKEAQDFVQEVLSQVQASDA